MKKKCSTSITIKKIKSLLVTSLQSHRAELKRTHNDILSDTAHQMMYPAFYKKGSNAS